MPAGDGRNLVLAFNQAINARDLDGLARLMTEDHVFIDSAGQAVRGRQAVLAAWRGFFEAFADYRNVLEELWSKDGRIVIRGRSTCADPRLHGPAIWTARVRDNAVAQWRVDDDTPATRKRLGLE